MDFQNCYCSMIPKSKCGVKVKIINSRVNSAIPETSYGYRGLTTIVEHFHTKRAIAYYHIFLRELSCGQISRHQPNNQEGNKPEKKFRGILCKNYFIHHFCKHYFIGRYFLLKTFRKKYIYNVTCSTIHFHHFLKLFKRND